MYKRKKKNRNQMKTKTITNQIMNLDFTTNNNENTRERSDLATFLLARGDYAWIGYGWIGCAPNMDYYRPKELDIDYGIPINGPEYQRVLKFLTKLGRNPSQLLS